MKATPIKDVLEQLVKAGFDVHLTPLPEPDKNTAPHSQRVNAWRLRWTPSKDQEPGGARWQATRPELTDLALVAEAWLRARKQGQGHEVRFAQARWT